MNVSSDPATVVLHLRITPAIAANLQRAADKEKRTMSMMARIMIEEGIIRSHTRTMQAQKRLDAGGDFVGSILDEPDAVRKLASHKRNDRREDYPGKRPTKAQIARYSKALRP
jgi:hypothetical protein